MAGKGPLAALEIKLELRELPRGLLILRHILGNEVANIKRSHQKNRQQQKRITVIKMAVGVRGGIYSTRLWNSG